MTVTEGINIKFNLLGFVIPTERFKSFILTFLYNPTELASEVKRVVESLAEAVAEAMRNMEERHAETQASLSSLNQCINVLRKKYQE